MGARKVVGKCVSRSFKNSNFHNFLGTFQALDDKLTLLVLFHHSFHWQIMNDWCLTQLFVSRMLQYKTIRYFAFQCSLFSLIALNSDFNRKLWFVVQCHIPHGALHQNRKLYLKISPITTFMTIWQYSYISNVCTRQPTPIWHRLTFYGMIEVREKKVMVV